MEDTRQEVVPMKIMIIQPWIKQGGAELISVHLALELTKMGHEAVIACTFIDFQGMPTETKSVQYVLPPARISKWLARSRIAFLIFGPWILMGLVWVNSSSFDILNPHNFPSMWIASLVSITRKIPIIWTCNEPPSRFGLKDIRKIGLGDYLGWLVASSPLDGLLARKVAIIHVLSHKTQLEVLKRYRRDSVVIRSGVDSKMFGHVSVNQMINKHGLADKFVLLTVGKLHPQKNQVLILRAFKTILSKIPNAILLIVGNGPMRRDLEELAKKSGISDHTLFLGFVDEQEIRELYQACNVNLFPAKNQSWGLTPFEALCAEKVSLVSSDSGAAEVIMENSIGIVTDPSPEGFAAGVLDIYKHPDAYREMARRGKDYVEKHLTHQAFAEGIIDLGCVVCETS